MSSNWRLILLWSFTLLAGQLVAGAARAEQSLDTIIIDAGYDKQTKIAIVPFHQGPELAHLEPISDIVSFDLARSGQFAPADDENMLSYPRTKQEVFFRDWRILGVEYLVIGNTSTDLLGNLSVNFTLFDVFNEREMVSDVIASSRDKWRDVAHKVSDQIFEAVTGIPGAFSTRILYVLAVDAGSPDASYRLEMADVDGERARTLFSSKEPIMSPSWGPEAKRIAYVSFETGRPAIVLQDVATGARELLTQFSGINGSPAFSPDGQRMAMVLSRDGNTEIYVMNLADRSLRRLTRNQVIDTEPSWSEDGRSIIYSSDRGGRPQIYRQDLTNNIVERLTFEGDYNVRARLLPGGKHLVFVHRRNGIDHIAWQDLERDDLRVLTATSLDESPSLAPNGTMLIYATQDQGRGILAVVSIDGRVKYRLPSSTGDVREPAWSPFIDPL